MCIVFAATDAAGFKAIVAANRDEFLDRCSVRAGRWVCPLHSPPEQASQVSDAPEDMDMDMDMDIVLDVDVDVEVDDSDDSRDSKHLMTEGKRHLAGPHCVCNVAGGVDLGNPMVLLPSAEYDPATSGSRVYGTWAAISGKNLRFSCVTNVREDKTTVKRDALSRGILPSAFTAGLVSVDEALPYNENRDESHETDLMDNNVETGNGKDEMHRFLESVERRQDRFNGFNLLVGQLVHNQQEEEQDTKGEEGEEEPLYSRTHYELMYTGNRRRTTSEPVELLPRVPYVMSNEELARPEAGETANPQTFPKIEYGRRLFFAKLNQFCKATPEIARKVKARLCNCHYITAEIDDDADIPSCPHFKHPSKVCTGVHYTNSEKRILETLLLELLTDQTSFPVTPEPFMDPVLAREMSSICVSPENLGGLYATRTHTIMLVDSQDVVTYVEVERYVTVPKEARPDALKVSNRRTHCTLDPYARRT